MWIWRRDWPPPGVERIWLQSPEGRVEAWFLAVAGSGVAPAVIFAHGNAETIDEASLRRSVEHYVSGIEVDGIFCGGFDVLLEKLGN